MNVEQQLTDELHLVADTLTAPPPPTVAALAREAEGTRTRSRVRWATTTLLAAAAVITAIVIGSQIGDPDAAPPPTHPSPSYYAAGVPYVHKGTLYVDHKAQPGSWFSAESAGEYTAAIASDRTAEILYDGKQVLRIDGPVLVVGLSPDGTKAAWIASTGPDSGELVVRDLPSERELGTVPVVLHPKGDQGVGTSLEVSNAGQALYELNDTSWSWLPGSRPTRAEQVDRADPNPEGFTSIKTWVRLSPDHLWGAWLTDRDGQVVPGSDAEESPVRDGLTVQKPGLPDSRFTIPLPAGTRASFLSWVSPTEVWVFTEKAGTPGLCDIVTRHCAESTNP
jgi:hypothetical protein